MISRDDIADLLARLVDKSLIIATRTGHGIRFRLLQTLAEYGRERLASSSDGPAVRARHARWVASFTCVAEPQYGPGWFAAVATSQSTTSAWAWNRLSARVTGMRRWPSPAGSCGSGTEAG